jgi:hypothetical protein
MTIDMETYVEKEYVESLSAGGYVKYGDNNLYPQYLVDLFTSSAVHGALVRSISTMIAGDGIESDNPDAKLEIAKLNLIKQIPFMAFDLKLQGGFYLEVKRNGNGEVNKLRHIPFQEIRIGEKDINGNILQFYHSLDWADSTCTINPIEPFKNKGIPGSVQLFYCLPYATGSNTYPHPDYIGAVNWVEVDKNTALFHNNNLANGLTPGMIINWKNGIPSPERQKAIKDEMQENASGVRNPGKFIMTFSDDDVSAPEFIPAPISDAADQYQFITDEATSKIMIGHRVVSPAMFGVSKAGSLGDTQELETAAKLFYHNVIIHMQRFIITCCERLLASNGVTGNLTINNSNPLLPEQSATETSQELISTLTTLIGNVNTGALTREQGSRMMTSILGYSKEDAEAILPIVLVEIEDIKTIEKQD